MVTKYTDEECRALDRKFEKPDEKVLCPRCGHELQYHEKNGSCWVICETDNCLYDAIRGV